MVRVMLDLGWVRVGVRDRIRVDTITLFQCAWSHLFFYFF